MTSVIPAILPEDFLDLQEKLEMVVGHVPMVHIDVQDKTLTDRANWPYAGDPSEFLKIAHEVEGFPFWEDLSFEAHLMVKHPEDIAEDWIRAGAERIIVHIESFESDDEVSTILNTLRQRFGSAASMVSVEIGLAVKLNTSMESILPHVLEADFIQLMAIDTIGSQGQAFNPIIFDRIRELKKTHEDTIIAVDGGITIEHADELIEAGAERLIIGSAIFESGDPEGSLFEFLEL
jgi:ribulose-phosphate 3-epimerase